MSSVEVTYKGSLYRASQVRLVGDAMGFGAGRTACEKPMAFDVQRRVAGWKSDKAFGIVNRRIDRGAHWVRVRTPSVGLLIALANAERDRRTLKAAVTGGVS